VPSLHALVSAPFIYLPSQYGNNHPINNIYSVSVIMTFSQLGHTHAHSPIMNPLTALLDAVATSNKRDNVHDNSS
jgi:hypothetical protein